MIDLLIRFGLEKEAEVAIRIGFVVWEGREHPQWRNLPIPSRIRGPDVNILSGTRFLKFLSFNGVKPQTSMPKMTA